MARQLLGHQLAQYQLTPRHTCETPTHLRTQNPHTISLQHPNTTSHTPTHHLPTKPTHPFTLANSCHSLHCQPRHHLPHVHRTTKAAHKIFHRPRHATPAPSLYTNTSHKHAAHHATARCTSALCTLPPAIAIACYRALSMPLPGPA